MGDKDRWKGLSIARGFSESQPFSLLVDMSGWHNDVSWVVA